MKRLPRALLVLATAAPAAMVPVRGAEVLRLRHAVTVTRDAQGVALNVPQGVGCRAGNAILVADTGNGRVLRLEITGTVVTVTGIVQVPEIPYPIRVDGDAGGALVVLDGRSRRLARIRPDGSFGGWIEIPGAEGSPSPVIRSFALEDGGGVLAADVAGRRVVEVAPSGSLVRSLPLPAEARGLTDVAVDARGSVFALDGIGRRVWIARRGDSAFTALTGSLAEDLDFPGAIEADPSGRLLVADLDGGGVVVLGPDGSFRGRQSAYGWKDGFLRYPADLCSTGRGLVAIADRENQRVQVFTVGE